MTKEELNSFVLDQLAGIEGITSKKMFGGIGYFYESKMFAMIGKGVFRFKVDESNIDRYINLGMEPFGGNGKGMPYYEVPEEVLNDSEKLKEWAWESIQIALE